MKKYLLFFIAFIALILVGAGSFYGGIVYGKGQASLSRQNFQASLQGFRNRQGGNGANFISGTILSKDASSITVQLPNNAGSKIIFYSDTTQVGKFDQGTSNDLTTGQTVSVNGSANSDGSVTAQSIQIRPANLPNRPAGQ